MKQTLMPNGQVDNFGRGRVKIKRIDLLDKFQSFGQEEKIECFSTETIRFGQ